MSFALFPIETPELPIGPKSTRPYVYPCPPEEITVLIILPLLSVSITTLAPVPSPIISTSLPTIF